jgi:hypothetical protein
VGEKPACTPHIARCWCSCRKFPLAHWLAATVYVARQALDEAERELAAGLTSEFTRTKFGAVALRWLRGLIHLARGDDQRARAEFEQELDGEGGGHMYANAARTRGTRLARCTSGKAAATRRLSHSRARSTGSRIIRWRWPRSTATRSRKAIRRPSRLPRRSGWRSAAHIRLARGIGDALAVADEGNALWLLPVEPLLHVSARPELWAEPLVRLRSRAA